MHRTVGIVMAFFAALVVVAHAAAQPAVAGGDPGGLVGALTKETGVTAEQAKGGAGALFSLAKGKMAPADFAQVAKAVPDMDGLLKAAPAMGGGAGMASLGTMAAAGSAFQKLGMSPSMVGKFVPVLTNFVGGSGGTDAAKLLAGALK